MKDYLSQDGAYELAGVIRAYWSRADKPVKVWVEKQDVGRKFDIFVVRSNIIFKGL